MQSHIFTQLSWKTALLAGALLIPYSYCLAGTVASVADSANPVNHATFFLGGQYSIVVAASWEQTINFSNVSIDASLVSIEDGFRSGTAHLMKAIGPGTTPASEFR